MKCHCAAAILLSSVVLSPAFAQSQVFTDVTKDAGVDTVVEAQYQNAGGKLWMSGIDLVDLDGDGKLDLFLSAHSQHGAFAALGDGKGHFKPMESGSTIPPSEIHVAYDLNEDGKLDFEMTDGDGGGRWWINQSTPGHLNFKRSDMTALGGQARQNAMIDINRDGKVDWLHEGGKHGTTTVDLGDGQGGLKPTRKDIISKPWGDGPGITPVDLNGDGFIDIIFSKRGYDEDKTGRCLIYLNDGKGNFTESTKECSLDEDGLQIEGAGDFRHSGALDLICLEHGKEVTVYLNDGKGKFTKLPDAVKMNGANRANEANWGIADTVDLDNDGIPDVMMNGRTFLYVLKGTGDGHFVYVNKEWNIPDYCDAAVDAGVCFGDIDGDGMLDVLTFRPGLGGDNRRVNAYHNDLPKQNFVNIRPVGLAGNKGAAGAKIRLYEAGGLGNAQKLIGSEQVAIFGRQVVHSYYAYTQTERHFGLGQRATVDVSVEFYPSGKKVEKKSVAANTTAVIEEK